MPKTDELEALVPKGIVINPINAPEVRLHIAPLPLKDVAQVVRYVMDSKELMSKFEGLDDKGLMNLLEGDILTRVNGLLRLLLPAYEKTLTDDWCSKHLSISHYRAIAVGAIKVNGLEEVFTLVMGQIKKFVGKQVEAAHHQATTS